MAFEKRELLAAVLGLASLLLLVLLLVPGGSGARAFAFLASGFPVGLMALGALRQRQLGRLAPVLLVLLLLLEAAVAAILLLSGEPPAWAARGSVLGLPPATVALLAGLWLLPLPLVVLAYGLTFDRTGITPEDLEGLRTRFGNDPAGADRNRR